MKLLAAQAACNAARDEISVQWQSTAPTGKKFGSRNPQSRFFFVWSVYFIILML